ncbi:hypothetical protein UFOVP116_288 [uncultured Caudovirales phage]|uniref:Uncharacterized protein n=1 Tax=uncultured Caudovirales phage TaxID=2100421 RepID=A0A6J5LAS1_9CAUD|nr:hypothetical protein UFOVP116_288 [uncultured Caudovirales phage]
MKYIKKLEIIEAIEFAYTRTGLDELKSFCGNNLLRYGPHRMPSLGPWAYIKVCENSHEIIIVMVGDMIIKHSNGKLSAMDKQQFAQQYEPAAE